MTREPPGATTCTLTLPGARPGSALRRLIDILIARSSRLPSGLDRSLTRAFRNIPANHWLILIPAAWTTFRHCSSSTRTRS
jgi:hypothetical protein